MQTTKKCKACKEDIDFKATKCSKCGTDQRGFFGKHPVLTVILVLFILGMIASAGNSENSNSNTAPKQSTTTDTQTSGNSVDTPKEKEPTVPTEYKSALAKATSYATSMHMSKRGVYDQLVSDYGEKFSAEAAQYAVDNVKADWNANALKKAKNYQDTMHMSPKAVHDQLTSDYGEKFTQAEADYAIQHLND